MLLHYQTRICISGHSKFNMDWNLFFSQDCFYITLLIIMLCLLGCLTYNIESAITFAILEKERKEKVKTLMWST